MAKKGRDNLRENHTKNLTYMGMFVALLAVGAWIVIPSAVPFTMQTFVVFLTVSILGMRQATLVILAYVLLGVVGVPVFSGFQGGLGVLLGPTGGYITGFVFAGMMTGAILKVSKRKTPVIFLAMMAGLVVCYAFGTAWFVFGYSGSSQSINASLKGSYVQAIQSALTVCVFPYIVPDIVKIVLAIIVSKKVHRHIRNL